MKTKLSVYRIDKLLLVVVLLNLSVTKIVSQTPDGIPVPDKNDPLEINTLADVIIFVVFPVLLVGFYVWWRRSKRKAK